MPSYTKAAAILVVFASYHLTIAAPAPRPIPDNQVGNAYSGAAGNASGGSVGANPDPASNILSKGGLLNGGSVLELLSNNGGKGGHASSGSAAASNLSTNGASTNTNTDGTTITGNGPNTVGNAYSGQGGQATGGNANDSEGGLISILSGNGGAGGNANSGTVGYGTVTQTKRPSGVGRIRMSRVIRLYLD